MKIAVVLAGVRKRHLQEQALESRLRYVGPILDAIAQEGVDLTFHSNLEGYEPKHFRLRTVVGRNVCLRRRRTGYDTTITLISPKLAWSLAHERYDAIIAIEYSLATLWAIIAGRLSGAKAIIFQEHRRSDSPLRRLIRCILARQASIILCNTLAASADVVRNLGVSSERVVVIPLLSAPPCEYMCDESIRLPQNVTGPLFLCVAQLIPRKNIQTLLEAADIVRNHGLSFTVWIVGTGPLKARLERERDRLGLQGIVEFLGELPYRGIGFAYAACDAFVFPSFDDVYGMAVLEALRFGKAIIVSSGAGAASDVAQHNVNGLVFDPEEPEQLAAQIAMLVQKPDLRLTMGLRSLEIAESRAPAVAARRLVRLLSGL